jgi:signal transduction histidine kinase
MPGLDADDRRVFQTAAWIWLSYLICLAVIDSAIYTGGDLAPVLRYHLISAIPALAFLALSYSPWLNTQAKAVAPSLILLITAVPILATYLFNLRLPPAPLSNVEGMVFRQLPVLLLGMVLVAWHASLPMIIFYGIGINLFELVLVFGYGALGQVRPVDFAFIILIRTICLVVVGIYIRQLITRLRIQKASLQSANAQLAHYASTLEQLTVSRERNRMSRELHDTVVHTLSGLSVQLETTKAYWEVDPQTAQGLLEQSLEATRSGLQETRRAIKSLRARPLDDLGLVNALRVLTETAAQRGRLATEVSLPERDPLVSPDVEQCLYRVAQEAVENVVRHANAHRLDLTLAAQGQDVEMVVQDDGIGFDAGQDRTPGHFGLAGMQERAALAGGKLTITSKVNGGTTVRLEIQGCLQ